MSNPSGRHPPSCVTGHHHHHHHLIRLCITTPPPLGSASSIRVQTTRPSPADSAYPPHLIPPPTATQRKEDGIVLRYPGKVPVRPLPTAQVNNPWPGKEESGEGGRTGKGWKSQFFSFSMAITSLFKQPGTKYIFIISRFGFHVTAKASSLLVGFYTTGFIQRGGRGETNWRLARGGYHGRMGRTGSSGLCG